MLRRAILAEQEIRGFAIVALALLPDHLHVVWNLPANDANYSTRLRRIKERFSRSYLAQGGEESERSLSRQIRGERGVWQRRFWEHTIRDEIDLERCVEYIHWNPVKHGYVSRPMDYQWSTFHQFVARGEYDVLWGTGGVAVPDVPGAEWE